MTKDTLFNDFISRMDVLIERDRVKEVICDETVFPPTFQCPECNNYIIPPANFCHMCGQRIK